MKKLVIPVEYTGVLQEYQIRIAKELWPQFKEFMETCGKVADIKIQWDINGQRNHR